MGLKYLPGYPRRRGFLLPVLLLLMSLIGVLALSVTAAVLQSGRAQGATALRRLALEAAEDAVAQCLRESAVRAAPWSMTGGSASGVRWSASIRSLGNWPTALDANGISLPEAHERITVVATTARGATVRLEQDYIRPPANGTDQRARRTVWRELENVP